MRKINSLARYHETNEWTKLHSNIFTIGISDFTQTVFENMVSVNH